MYAGPDDGTWAESGALARWEKKAASQDQLDSFVLHALNCDLIDRAGKLIRQKDREVLEGAGHGPEQAWRPQWLTALLDTKAYNDWEHMSDRGWLDGCAFLRAWKVDQMTISEIVQALQNHEPDGGWSEWKVRQRIDQEKKNLAKQFYGTTETP